MSVQLEKKSALLDTQRVAREYGTTIAVFLRGEAGVVRDAYKSIAQFTQAGAKTIYAWPIIYDPQQRELEKAGIFERCECLVWTPMKEWTDQGLTFERIDAVRATVVLGSSDDVFLEYRIRQKQRASRFADTDLHIVLALDKRE